MQENSNGNGNGSGADNVNPLAPQKIDGVGAAASNLAREVVRKLLANNPEADPRTATIVALETFTQALSFLIASQGLTPEQVDELAATWSKRLANDAKGWSSEWGPHPAGLDA